MTQGQVDAMLAGENLIAMSAHMSRREAALLAKKLREARYCSVSAERCYDYVCNIVDFYASSSDERHEIRQLATEALFECRGW